MNHYLEVAPNGHIIMYTNDGTDLVALNGGTIVQVDREVDTRCTMYLSGELVDFGPRPSLAHFMDPTTHTWAVPGKTALQVAQDDKWEAIKAERDRRERTTFPYRGKQLECDVVSTLRMSGAKEAALVALETGTPFSEVWTCADNTHLLMSAEDVIGMLPALAAWSSGLHATGRDLRAQIYHSSATLESVTAITWPTD